MCPGDVIYKYGMTIIFNHYFLNNLPSIKHALNILVKCFHLDLSNTIFINPSK